MPVLSPSDLAFNGEEVKDMSEAVHEAVFAKPELGLFHSFVPGIKTKKQIVILGLFNALTGSGSGGCDPVSNPNTITNIEKFWEPKTVSDRITECWKDLLEIFFIWGTQNGIKKPDLTKTDFWQFMTERRSDSLEEEVLRIIWFSDVDAADVDASPPGVLTSGTNTAFFNKIDGYWKQIFAIVAADASRLTAGLGSRNGQATFAAQEFTATDTTNRVVTLTLQNMRFGADTRLRGMDGLQYIVTQSVSDQYERELIDAKLPFTTEAMENGITVLKNGNITVISFDFWDRIIREHFSDGTKFFLPHRALLSVKSNVQIGTEQESNLKEMDSIYDNVTKKNHLDTMYDIDAKIVEDYKIQAAY